MAEIKKSWYVLRAIGGKEKKAKEALEKEGARLGYGDYVTAVVVPVEKVYSQTNGKKTVRERVLFSGYVFVECSLVNDVESVIQNTPNIIDFVRETDTYISETEKRQIRKDYKKKYGEEYKIHAPVAMSAAEVARMIGTTDESADDTQEERIPYFVGDNVKVTDGPFNGFTGIIEAVDEEKKKLSVKVKIFGRETPLELGYLQVQKE